MKITNSILVILFASAAIGQSAESTLKKSVAYHDPEGEWGALSKTFYFTETRPGGEDRSTVVQFDNQNSYMKINRNDEEVYEVDGEAGTVLKGDQDEDRAIVLRNYYLYLWGLPMKLMDEGTSLEDTGSIEKVGDVTCHVLRVPYEKDTWYFYFHSETGRLVQYKFYQDAEETKGELITLEDEVQVGDMRIPQKRTWYVLPGMKLLGTDILSRVE